MTVFVTDVEADTLGDMVIVFTGHTETGENVRFAADRSGAGPLLDALLGDDFETPVAQVSVHALLATVTA